MVALQLQLAQGDRAVHAVRIRSANDQPLLVSEAWVPEKVGAGITRAKLRKQALYEILMAQGITFGRVIQEITAVSADPRYAGLLNTEVGAPRVRPRVRMPRILYAADRQPLQHLTLYFSPERSRLLMDVGIEGVNTFGAAQITHDVMAKPVS